MVVVKRSGRFIFSLDQVLVNLADLVGTGSATKNEELVHEICPVILSRVLLLPLLRMERALKYSEHISVRSWDLTRCNKMAQSKYLETV